MTIIEKLANHFGFIHKSELAKTEEKLRGMTVHADRLVSIIEDSGKAVVVRDRDEFIDGGDYTHMIILGKCITVRNCYFRNGGLLLGPTAEYCTLQDLHCLGDE